MSDGEPEGPYTPLKQDVSTPEAAEEGGGSREPPREDVGKEDGVSKKPWFVNPHVCWRHPVARIVLVVTIMALDFYIYGEDPVNDSHVEYNFPVLGHIYGLLFLWPKQVSLVLLRVLCIVVFVLIGMYISRQWIHHKLLRDCMGLTMFEGNKGTLLIMLFGSAGAMHAAALAYNALVPLISENADLIQPRTWAEMRNVGKVFQIWSVFLDIMSIVQIIDAVLQDRTVYPNWAVGVKRIWIEGWRGWFRVVAAWFMTIAAVAISTMAILNTGPAGPIQWRDEAAVGGTSEVTRTLFLNLIIICDLMTVCQDWEFPTFNEPLDVKIAGTSVVELSCNCFPRSLCKCLHPDIAEFFHFVITGPWLTYGPLILVMMADLGCAKTQFMYTPQTYGQYAAPDTGRIWTITDPDYLTRAYYQGNLVRPELVTWAARHDNVTGELLPHAQTDIPQNARYLHTPAVWLTILPGVATIVAFACLVCRGEEAWRSQAMEMIGKAGEEVEMKVEKAAETLKSQVIEVERQAEHAAEVLVNTVTQGSMIGHSNHRGGTDS